MPGITRDFVLMGFISFVLLTVLTDTELGFPFHERNEQEFRNFTKFKTVWDNYMPKTMSNL